MNENAVLAETPQAPAASDGKTVVRDSASLGAVVRRLRKEADLTQQEAAAMCNVGTRFLSDLENGKTSLHLGKTLQVLQAFGMIVVVKKKGLGND